MLSQHFTHDLHMKRDCNACANIKCNAHAYKGLQSISVAFEHRVFACGDRCVALFRDKKLHRQVWNQRAHEGLHIILQIV